MIYLTIILQTMCKYYSSRFTDCSPVQVGRPSNMPQAQSIIEEIERESKNYNRIYVGGIHKVGVQCAYRIRVVPATDLAG